MITARMQRLLDEAEPDREVQLQVYLPHHESEAILRSSRRPSREKALARMRCKFETRWKKAYPAQLDFAHRCWLSSSGLTNHIPIEHLRNTLPAIDWSAHGELFFDVYTPSSLARHAIYAEPSGKAGIAVRELPDDPLHLNGVRLSGQDITIALLDRKMIEAHPDLHLSDPQRLPKRGDFSVNGSHDGAHATRMAGLAAGSTTGVAPKAQILPLVIDGHLEVACQALNFALDQDVDVICLADGWRRQPGSTHPVWWRRTCESLLAARVMLAASAGNDEHGASVPDQIFSPGDCPPPFSLNCGRTSSAICCGVYDRLAPCKPSDFGNSGPTVWESSITPSFNDYPDGLAKPDLFAPAGNLKVPNHGDRGFGNLRGVATSPATAITAGCLALLAQASKDARQRVYPERIYEALVKTSKPFDPPIDWAAGGKIQVKEAWDYGRDSSRNWW